MIKNVTGFPFKMAKHVNFFELKKRRNGRNEGLEDDGLGLCTKVPCERSLSGKLLGHRVGRQTAVAP